MKAEISPPVERTVIVTMAESDAAILRSIIAKIGGSSVNGPRRTLIALDNALEAIGVECSREVIISLLHERTFVATRIEWEDEDDQL